MSCKARIFTLFYNVGIFCDNAKLDSELLSVALEEKTILEARFMFCFKSVVGAYKH